MNKRCLALCWFLCLLAWFFAIQCWKYRALYGPLPK